MIATRLRRSTNSHYAKVQSPERISDFHPISLCNVLYKIVAKALANHLRLVLVEVIFDTQSVFILGRNISDNAIVGFEFMHALRTRKKCKKMALAINLDMSKACDRVE